MCKFNIPILLITYKRSKYLKKVLSKIKKINPKILYVYSDGPKDISENENVTNSRKIIKKINWCKIKTKFNETNQGIESVPELAIDWVFKKNKKAIILEDDTLPNLSFFYFCKHLLNKYEKNKNISMISGTNLAPEYSKKINESYFFSKYSNIWGWATWRDKWKKYDKKIVKWPKFKESKLKSYSYYKKEYIWWNKMFELTYKNRSRNWDYQWTFVNFYKKKLSIVPKKNLISNIGVKGHGSNSSKLLNLKTNLIQFPLIHPKIIKVNEYIDKYICKKTYVIPNLDFRLKNKLTKIYNNLKNNFKN